MCRAFYLLLHWPNSKAGPRVTPAYTVNHNMHNECSRLLLTLHKKRQIASWSLRDKFSLYPPISFSFHHSFVPSIFLSLITAASIFYILSVFFLHLSLSIFHLISFTNHFFCYSFPAVWSLFGNWNRSMTLNYHQYNMSSQIWFCLN